MDSLQPKGLYEIECYRDGKLIWTDRIENIVPTEGRNALLATALDSANYTSACYMGIIAFGGSAPAVTDTMVTHGFIEAGIAAPTFANRQAISWTTPTTGTIATSNPCSFVITDTGGTAKGCFVAFNGANSTIADTAGALMSAGYFSGGDKILVPTDVLQVTYSLTLVGA